MLGRKQKQWMKWAGTLCLVLLLAACTSTDFHWITPVPAADAPSADVAATVEPEEETPAAETAATETPAEEAVAEAAEGDDTDDDTDSEAGEDGSAGEPAPITHALSGREDCTECHEAGGDRRGSPPDHAHLTDQVCVYCHMPEEGEDAIPPLPERAETDFCLGCHGPHEELMARTADYVTENGLQGNPHMYVPHDGTNISSCRNCHRVHELPVTAPETIQQADVEFCFTACHHEGDFEPCSACHDEDE